MMKNAQPSEKPVNGSRPVTIAFDIAAKGLAELGESPVWDPQGECIWWIDIAGRKLFRTTLKDRETRSWATPEDPGFVALLGPGLPVLGMETGIFAFNPATMAFERTVPLDAPGKRFNDAAVDPAGRLWVTVMAMDLATGAGGLYRVTPALALEQVFDRLTIPNGLAVDGAARRLYVSDSHPDIRKIWTAECDLETGAVGARSAFADTTSLGGRPDGAAIDRLGRYWIAALDDAALYVYSPEGQFLERVGVPFASPTKLAFAGADGRTIVVTSKADGALGGSLAIGRPGEWFAASRAQPFWRAGEI